MEVEAEAEVEAGPAVEVEAGVEENAAPDAAYYYDYETATGADDPFAVVSTDTVDAAIAAAEALRKKQGDKLDYDSIYEDLINELYRGRNADNYEDNYNDIYNDNRRSNNNYNDDNNNNNYNHNDAAASPRVRAVRHAKGQNKSHSRSSRRHSGKNTRLAEMKRSSFGGNKRAMGDQRLSRSQPRRRTQ